MRMIDREFDRPGWLGQHTAGAHALAFASAPGPRTAAVRYVLDQAASSACGDLIRHGNGLFDPDIALFRLPAEDLWIELYVEPDTEPDGAFRRLGYHVQADPAGRAGTIRPFIESGSGRCMPLPCVIAFDLDGLPPLPTVRTNVRRLEHAGIPHLGQLLGHARLHLDDTWLRQQAAARSGAVEAQIRELAEGTWFALPLLFAFAALLNSPQVTALHPSDLARLNRARQRRGRPPLLDHIEVRLALGEASAGNGTVRGTRATPRLHFVRGHLVQRDGKTFWRQAHLRGDTHGAIVSRTVSVTAAKRLRGNGAARHVRQAAWAVG